MGFFVSEYETYRDGTLYTRKIKTGEYYDLYRCVGCGKSWKSNAKRIGHKEAACRRYR